jgi:DNA-binding SARP family transcriptional activator
MSEVRVGVLGTSVAEVDGVHHQPGAARLRALLAVLAMHAGRPVTTDHIIAAVWGSTAPTGVASTLQGYVADLRRLLEPQRAPREPARVLVTVPSGYALHLAPEAIDLTRFEAALHRAAHELAVIPNPLRPWVAATERPVVRQAAELLDAALDEWRGEPLTDLGTDLEVECERDRLRAMRLEAEILRHAAHLALGRHATAVADLEAWPGRIPGTSRSGTVGHRAGRHRNQADALGCLRRLRRSLSEELGLDPSPQVRELETAIFRQELPVPSPGDAVPVEPSPAASSGSDWPFVGRRREMAQLRGALTLAEQGRVQFVHLSGELGIGKTRLARELATCAGSAGSPWPGARACGRPRRSGSGPGTASSDRSSSSTSRWRPGPVRAPNPTATRPALLGLGERTLRTLRR